MKRIALTCLLVLGFLIVPKAKAQSYDVKKLEVVLRQVGFDLLRKSGDRTSRVMPIERLKDKTYRIHFEKEFEFVTDTLINTIDAVFKQKGVQQGYIASVKTVNSQSTVYTYEVSTVTEFQIPCIGVTNPTDKYFVEISFLPEPPATKSTAWLILGLLMIGGVGLFIYSKRGAIPKTTNLGNYFYDLETKKLKLNQQLIELTHQEEKLLELLYNKLNELVSRDLLLEEIWEKEGVVVTTRSLDVLVSKLRKKLSEDERIKITNIHGKGYKLEVVL